MNSSISLKDMNETHKPLRVLMVANGTPGVPPKTSGGLELVIFYLVKWISNLGHIVTLVDTLSNDERDMHVDLSFCKVIRIKHFSLARFHRRETGYVTHELLRQLSMLSFSLKLLVNAPRILLSFKYDVIHVHYRYPFLALWIAKNILRIKVPIVFHYHNAWMTREKIPLLLRFFWFPDMIVVRRAHSVVALSLPMKHGLIKFYQAPKEKIAVISNGVEVPKPKILGMNQASGAVIVCISNIMTIKNQEILIDALGRLRKQFANVKLLLVGEVVDNEYYRRLQLKVKELDLFENIHFLGGVSHQEVWSILEKADIAISPSKFEAMSMAALEYLASGKPTLLSRIPSFTNMCDDSVVLFFDPNNPLELSNVLCDLISNKRLREELSKRGRRLAISRYSWLFVCKRIEELYRRLIVRQKWG